MTVRPRQDSTMKMFLDLKITVRPVRVPRDITDNKGKTVLREFYRWRCCPHGWLRPKTFQNGPCMDNNMDAIGFSVRLLGAVYDNAFTKKQGYLPTLHDFRVILSGYLAGASKPGSYLQYAGDCAFLFSLIERARGKRDGTLACVLFTF